MKTILELMMKLTEKKMMVRFGSWPGGHVSLTVYNHDQSEQNFYEAKSHDELPRIEADIRKDWGHLLTPTMTLPSPLPKGFPVP